MSAIFKLKKVSKRFGESVYIFLIFVFVKFSIFLKIKKGKSQEISNSDHVVCVLILLTFVQGSEILQSLQGFIWWALGVNFWRAASAKRKKNVTKITVYFLKALFGNDAIVAQKRGLQILCLCHYNSKKPLKLKFFVCGWIFFFRIYQQCSLQN